MTATRHPARFSRQLEPTIREWLAGYDRVLDPFAGTGRYGLASHYNELEPEWASQCPGVVTVGDARHLPYPDGAFDAVVTSPCLAPGERVLTADLRWVPSGDVRTGDRLIAFDEFPPFTKANGHAARRKWRIATVTKSAPAKKECVRVHLADGAAVVCTADHPWLVRRAHSSSAWVRADQLLRFGDRPSGALRQLDVWTQNMSRDAGWLAGMFDGEGSLSFGAHGAPKLMVTQNPGPIMDQCRSLIESFGWRTHTYDRNDGRSRMDVRGGFPEILRFLGEMRPERLVAKLGGLDLASRTIQPTVVPVVAVEPLGSRDIQGITTDTGTYIGEGFLHHNTYGNRMADHHEAKEACRACRGSGDETFGGDGEWYTFGDRCPKCDGTGFRVHKRNTYTHVLGRKLTTGNSGAMQWGAEYRALHEAAWAEVWRVLRPGGVFILNVKDHIRKGERVEVTWWHIDALRRFDLDMVGARNIETPGQRQGQNGSARMSYEMLLRFEKPADTAEAAA